MAQWQLTAGMRVWFAMWPRASAGPGCRLQEAGCWAGMGAWRWRRRVLHSLCYTWHLVLHFIALSIVMLYVTLHLITINLYLCIWGQGVIWVLSAHEITPTVDCRTLIISSAGVRNLCEGREEVHSSDISNHDTSTKTHLSELQFFLLKVKWMTNKIRSDGWSFTWWEHLWNVFTL